MQTAKSPSKMSLGERTVVSYKVVSSDGRRTVVGPSDGHRTAVAWPSDGPTAVPGRRPSRFFPSGGLGAAAPRAPGGFGGAGAPPIGGVWGVEAPPGKNNWLRALKNTFFLDFWQRISYHFV